MAIALKALNFEKHSSIKDICFWVIFLAESLKIEIMINNEHCIQFQNAFSNFFNLVRKITEKMMWHKKINKTWRECALMVLVPVFQWMRETSLLLVFPFG